MLDEVELEHRLSDVESRSKSNTKRIDKLEENTEAINSLATSMQVIAVKQEQIGNTVEKLDSKVESLEAKPGKKYDSIVEKVVLIVVTAFVTYILSHVGL